MSGATQLPVAGARVIIAGQEYSTDSEGVAQIPVAVATGADVDVEAQGFLPRTSTTSVAFHFSLWPVADVQETDAVRQMAFNNVYGSPDILYPFGHGNLYVTMPSASPELMSAWRAAAKSFGSLFGLRYVVGNEFQYVQNEVAVYIGDSAAMLGCPASVTLGFCRGPSVDKTFSVVPDRAIDPVVINRVLASLFLAADPFPGLLNPFSPADTLTPFEEQSIRMILQHQYKTRWPDDDRP